MNRLTIDSAAFFDPTAIASRASKRLAPLDAFPRAEGGGLPPHRGQSYALGRPARQLQRLDDALVSIS